MKKLGKILLVFVLLTTIIIIHEGGHAFAMYKNGIELEKFSIGLSLPFLNALSIKKKIGETSFEVHPLLIGGYVRPSKKGCSEIEKLPYFGKASIHGSGVLFNLIFAGILILLSRKLKKQKIVDRKTLIILIASPVIIIFSKFFIGLFFPIASFIIAFYVFKNLKDLVGPITIFKEGYKIMDFPQILMFLIGASIGIGLINLLPFSIFDGGKLVVGVINEFNTDIAKWYGMITIIPAAVLITYAITK